MKHRKTILILVNHEIVIYNFRKELVKKLLEKGHRVIISSPDGEKINKLVELGCEHDDVTFDRHGFNPLDEFRLIKYYKKLIDEYNPDIIFSYTIKPNIYGAFVAKTRNIPFVATITGLGTAVENKSVLQKLLILMYKISFNKVKTIFFQNKSNMQFFIDNNINIKAHKLLPGSGVNLKDFTQISYPSNSIITNFAFISRIMKDKGIEEYLQAAEYIKKKYSNVEFIVCGFLDENYEEMLKEYHNNGIINYLGMISDVRSVFQETHCIILPSYHEGMSNILLEAAASGRPILASNIPGCKEIFDEGITGFGFEPRNTESLISSIEAFLNLTYKEKEDMGKAGHNKIKNEFDRKIVVNEYIEEIEQI